MPHEDSHSSLSPCYHEEADSRLLIHAKHCADQGHQNVLIRTVDTDVVVLAISTFHLLSLSELWIAFGTKAAYRYIPIHEIARSLDWERAQGLRFFHALTGCDSCSSFNTIGKLTAWNIWKSFPAVTNAFVRMSLPTTSIPDDIWKLLERFVVLLYDRTSESGSVNETRKHLFAKGRQLDNIPPTEAALREHVKRAAYQAGQVWGQSLIQMQELPSPEQYGWTKVDDKWCPFWTQLPEASKTCKELVKCGCKKSCDSKRCKCTKADLPCTELCFCKGSC